MPPSSRTRRRAERPWRLLRMLASAAAMWLVTACATAPRPAAKDAFAAAAKSHLASAEATGPERDRLLAEAATGYERVLRLYRDQPQWRASALRSLAGVRATQGRLDEAVQLYRRVGTEYRSFEFEVLQAWKSAGDLLWEAGRHPQAREYYRQIVARFDQPDAPALYRTVVRAAATRL